MPSTMDELLEGARGRGDPLADQFVLALVGKVEPERLLEFLQNTLRLSTRLHLEHEPDVPPEQRSVSQEFEAYLTATARPPSWMDARRVERGSELFRRHVATASLALGVASLPTCYCWSEEAAVLMRTQRLARETPRRVLETSQFVLDVMSPGGLRLEARPFAVGVQAVQKVRLLHAVVRFILANRAMLHEAALRRHGVTSSAELMQSAAANPWLGLLVPHEPSDGTQAAQDAAVAINQEELAGTLLTFSLVILQSFERIGIRVSDEQRRDYLHAWKLVGHMMGIEPALLELAADPVGAEQLRQAIMVRQRRATAHAQALTQALSQFLAQNLSLLFGLDRWLPVQRIPRLGMRMLLEKETLAADGVQLDLVDKLLYVPYFCVIRVLGFLENLRWVNRLSKALFAYLARKVWGWRNMPFATVAAHAADAQPQNMAQAPVLENWSATVQTQPASVVHPSSVREVAQILTETARYPSPVRVMGSFHSTTACSSADGGTVIRLDRLRRVLEIGPDFVEAEAGALYVDVAHELHRRGLEFYINLQIGNITMGAAACSSTKDGAFPGEFAQSASYCTAMTVVEPSGTVRTITDAEPALMQAARSSHGLLGVVCAVRFRVRRIEPISIEHRNMGVEAFLSALPSLLAGNSSIEYYLYPFIDRVTVQLRSKVTHSGPFNRRVWWWRNFSVARVEPRGARVIGLIPVRLLRDAASAAFSWIGSEFLRWFCRADKTYASDQTTRYEEQPGNAGFTFSLWGFPQDRFPQILRDYVDLVRRHYADTGWRSHMLTVGYAVSQDSQALLSYSWSGPVITIDPTGFGGEDWDSFLDAYNRFCSERGGIPLLNQTPRVTYEQARNGLGERLQRFEALRRRMDPTNRLLNPYFAALLSGDAQGR